MGRAGMQTSMTFTAAWLAATHGQWLAVSVGSLRAPWETRTCEAGLPCNLRCKWEIGGASSGCSLLMFTFFAGGPGLWPAGVLSPS